MAFTDGPDLDEVLDEGDEEGWLAEEGPPGWVLYDEMVERGEEVLRHGQ